MRTIIYRVDATTGIRDLSRHSLVYLAHGCVGRQSACNRRLIRRNQNGKIASGNPLERLERSRQEYKLIPTLDVVRTIGVDDAVTVEENRASSTQVDLT
jgi:hypothetical protein